MQSLIRGLLGYPTAVLSYLYRWLLRPLLPAVLLLAIEPPPAKKAGPTTLLLVRHGQSMHNISSVNEYGDTGADETLFDAPLSPLGEQQVAALLGNSDLAAADLIIVSPLTRAVQTMFGAFPKAPRGCPPVELWPLAAEHLTDSCDVGSGASALAARFPSLTAQCRALPEVWWYTDEETSRTDAQDSRAKYRECGFMEPEPTLVARIDAFVAELRARPEATIAIVGHSDFFNYLMETYAGIRCVLSLYLPQTCTFSLNMPPSPALTARPPRIARTHRSGYWLANAEVYKLSLPPASAASAPEDDPPLADEVRGPTFVTPRHADKIESQAIANLGAASAADLESALGLADSDGVAAMCARLAKDERSRHDMAVSSGEVNAAQAAFRYFQVLHEPCIRAQGLSAPKAKLALAKLWRASEAGSALKRWCELLEQTDRVRYEREAEAPPKDKV